MIEGAMTNPTAEPGYYAHSVVCSLHGRTDDRALRRPKDCRCARRSWVVPPPPKQACFTSINETDFLVTLTDLSGQVLFRGRAATKTDTVMLIHHSDKPDRLIVNVPDLSASLPAKQ